MRGGLSVMRVKLRPRPQTISSVVILRAVVALTAIAALVLANPPAALAQTPPTPNINQYGLGLIGAPAAWALRYSGAGVTVAVGDTGIDTTHPAFAGKIDPRSMNFTLPSPGAAYDPSQITDTGNHGTHVAGIIASSAASGVPGVAYNANLVMLRLLNSCATDQNCDAPGISNASVAGLNYFAGLNNVMLYNASYGPTVATNLTSWPATTIDRDEEAAALNALAKGKIIVAANGNDRYTNPVAGLNPNGLALYPFIQPPNANAGVYQDGGNNYNFFALQQQPGLIIAVTAVGQAKTIADYAQTCGVTASWCVAAPGGDPDAGIYSTLPSFTYGYMYGTSMATPMVSGALAVLQQAYPTYSARDLANVLFATAENIGGQAADNATYGYGLIRLDRATAGPTTLAAGSSVSVAAQQTTYWSQPLTTAGSFTVTGPGYLIIAGRTTATGNAAVNAGALGVDGTLTLQTQMTVAQGGMLAGFGSIFGNVTINGTLNAGQLPNYGDLIANNGGTLPAGIPPTGTSPGTLTFQGNVALTATATTRANIDGTLQVPGGPGTYDKIIVTGAGYAFAANGTLVPVLRGIPGGNNTYIPSIGAMFPFVTAQNGASITGQFASLTEPTTGLAPNSRFDVVYFPTSITLNVTPLTFQNLAVTQNLNSNQQAVATVLDEVRPKPGISPKPVEAAVFDNLYGENTVSGVDTALSSLSGQGHAAMPAAIMNAFSGFSDVIADHQAMTLTGGASVQAAFTPSIAFAYAGTGPSAEARVAGIPFPQTQPAMASARYGQWTTWGQVYGGWSNVGTANGLPGYTSSSGGFVLGADRMLSSDLVAGGAFGYTRTSTSSADTSGTTNTYAGALYASWTPGSFIFDGRLAAGATATGTSRSIVFPGEATPTAIGSVNGWEGLVTGEAGYRFNVSGVTLKPYVGLTAQTLNQNAFTESTDFGLSFPGQTFTKVTTAVGTWATTTFQSGSVTFMPQAKVAWMHDLRDDTLTTQTALFDVPFAISAADPGRDAAVIGFQLAAWQTQNLRVFGSYTGEFRSNATSQQVAGGLRVIW